VAAAISALTKRTSPDPDELLGASVRGQGLRGTSLGLTMLDYADWYRLAGRAEESLNLYDLARHATEFDRYLEYLGGLPKAMGRRWSLRGQRFAWAVSGELQARRDRGQRPSDSLIKAAESAAELLLMLGESRQAIRLCASLATSQVDYGEALAALDTIRMADGIENTHLCLVMDWTARGAWERAAEHLNSAVRTLPDDIDADAARFTDSGWLTGDGLAVARSGVDLARRLADVLDGTHVAALRAMSMQLGAVGLPQEALASAEEVVRLWRRTDSTTLGARHYLGWPLWRLGVCLREVGRQEDGIAAALESVPYFRKGATSDTNRDTCAMVVREVVLMLIAQRRHSEALPLALEQVRRYEELAQTTHKRLPVREAVADLAKVFYGLGRPANAAESYTKLAAQWMEAVSEDAEHPRKFAVDAHWAAARSWRDADDPAQELASLRQVHGLLATWDDPPEQLRQWERRRRSEMGCHIGRLLMRDPLRWQEALPALREAHEALLRTEPTEVSDWYLQMAIVLSYLGDCLERETATTDPTVLDLRRKALDCLYQADRNSDWASDLAENANLLAMTLVRAGEPGQALATLDAAWTGITDETPHAEWVRYISYLASVALGDNVRADAEIEDAFRIANSRADEDVRRCLILLGAGHELSAVALVRQAIDAQRRPDALAIWYLRRDLDDVGRIVGHSPVIDRIANLLSAKAEQ
jgi:tetratricopeptide (TPR) repeat protein